MDGGDYTKQGEGCDFIEAGIFKRATSLPQGMWPFSFGGKQWM